MATGREEVTLSEESHDVNCTFCTKRSRIKQAASYCSDCTKYLCEDCVETHNEYIEGHTLVDVHDVYQLDNMLTEKCGKHRDQVIDMFCSAHDQLACNLCATLKHRSCHVKQITESLEELSENRNVPDVTEQLQTALQHMDQAISDLDKHTEELSQRESKYLLEIEEYTKRLLVRIEDLKKNARTDVTTKHLLASQAEKNKQACSTCKTYINKCLTDMETSNSRKAHLFILKKKGQKLTRNVETLSKDTEQLIKSTQFVYQTNTRIEQYLTDITYLGRIEDKYQASLKATISATIRDDAASCNIQGCCLLTDGTVLLADCNNRRLKHVGTSDCTIKDHCDLNGFLFGITCTSPYEVAVCSRCSNIKVVTLGNKMACTSTIQLNHNCSRIVQSNGELFITYENCVYVHDLTGTLLRTIYENGSGGNTFSGIEGIVLNQTGDRIYVADWYNGLICTDRAGHEVFRLSEEELGPSRAYGVCTDQKGNVLVCGYVSNNVVQVTEEGRVIGEILSKADGIEKPKCLCYDADRNRLYVCGETSNLPMFQLV